MSTTDLCEHCKTERATRTLSIQVNQPGDPDYSVIQLGRCCRQQSCAMALIAEGQKAVASKLEFDKPELVETSSI